MKLMCGIVGIISSQPIHISIAKKMNETLAHRGPDGSGYLSSAGNIECRLNVSLAQLTAAQSEYFVFAHRRLAIHDLSDAGRQPMQYRDRYWIVFNGEIYNYLELKEDLESKGYVFHSQTDTEVLIAAYDYYGAECLQKFNGDWAFVLIDTLKNKIFMSRDRFGIKPLYIYFERGLFLFASEIKALLQHPAVIKKPNFNYIKDYIQKGALEYIVDTAFENIFHFNFASYFEGDLNELLSFHPAKLKIFFTISPNLSTEKITQEKLQSYAKTYVDLLRDAVLLRMRADVKVGANLSGGLDSASIVALMHDVQKQENHDVPLQTFSSVYHSAGTTECDESAGINAVTNFFKLKSHHIEPSIYDIPTEHRKMIYHLDTPPDSTLMSSWYTAKLLAQEKVTVTLTGEGADEQLAGYLRYLTYFFAQTRTRDIFSLYANFKNIHDAKIYIYSGITMHVLKKLTGKKIAQFFYALMERDEKLFTPVNKKLQEDIFSMLVNLHHIDERVFMAFSIEQRGPFMDYRVVELLASIPVSFKLANGWTKYLARFAFDSALPKSLVWNKKKLGWPIPEKYWFEGELKLWMETTVKQSAFLKQYYFSWWRRFEKIPLHQKIRLLNLAVWYDVFFDKK